MLVGFLNIQNLLTVKSFQQKRTTDWYISLSSIHHRFTNSSSNVKHPL